MSSSRTKPVPPIDYHYSALFRHMFKSIERAMCIEGVDPEKIGRVMRTLLFGTPWGPGFPPPEEPRLYQSSPVIQPLVQLEQDL